MKPIGPLMIEHRLIEKMLAAFMRHIDDAEKSQKVDPIIVEVGRRQIHGIQGGGRVFDRGR